MSVYVHHVPGRLRVRAQWLAGSPRRRERVSLALSELTGINELEVNDRAGSVTVIYDPTRVTAEAILARFGAESPATNGNGAKPVPPPDAIRSAAAASAAKLGALFGKALFDAMLHKGVERSVRLLTGK